MAIGCPHSLPPGSYLPPGGFSTTCWSWSRAAVGLCSISIAMERAHLAAGGHDWVALSQRYIVTEGQRYVVPPRLLQSTEIPDRTTVALPMTGPA